MKRKTAKKQKGKGHIYFKNNEENYAHVFAWDDTMQVDSTLRRTDAAKPSPHVSHYRQSPTPMMETMQDPMSATPWRLRGLQTRQTSGDFLVRIFAHVEMSGNSILV